mgnify:CR=1 FL=1|tara:strand:+ start:166 stop:645 length:480 start_codon:yes stop_codon:yes gene_type:complete
MKISKNNNLPEVNFFWMAGDGPKSISTSEIFKNKKILLVGVPGAFTPTCSLEHLPGFIKNKKIFYSKGIDKIIFVSVNDPFVLSEWSKAKNETDIQFIGDSDAEFAKQTGLILDLSIIGLGIRLSRFAMIVDNMKVIMLLDEEGGDLENSTAEKVLESI